MVQTVDHFQFHLQHHGINYYDVQSKSWKTNAGCITYNYNNISKVTYQHIPALIKRREENKQKREYQKFLGVTYLFSYYFLLFIDILFFLIIYWRIIFSYLFISDQWLYVVTKRIKHKRIETVKDEKRINVPSRIRTYRVEFKGEKINVPVRLFGRWE